MIESGFINGDCMEYLKEYPDNYFDLCIADPPYGDGGVISQTAHGLANVSTAINRGGWHGKQKYHLGTPLHIRTPQEGQELREQAEHGRRNTQKKL